MVSYESFIMTAIVITFMFRVLYSKRTRVKNGSKIAENAPFSQQTSIDYQ